MSNLAIATIKLDVHRDGVVIAWIGGYPYSANTAQALWRVLQDLTREPSERLAEIERAEQVRRENNLKFERKRAEARTANAKRIADHEAAMEAKRKARVEAGPWTGIQQLANRLQSERSELVAKPGAGAPKPTITLEMLGLAKSKPAPSEASPRQHLGAECQPKPPENIWDAVLQNIKAAR